MAGNAGACRAVQAGYPGGFFKDLTPADIDEALKILKEKEKYYLVITEF